MQLIESLLFLLVIIQLLSLFIKRKERQSLAFIGLGLLAFHFILGEARWQMGLLYLIEIIIVFILIKDFKSKTWVRIVACCMAVILVAVSAILTSALPVFSLPETTGKYSVGLDEIYLKIEEQDELITAESSDKRELMVNVWYPSTSSIENRAQYLPNVEREGFALKYGLPASAFNYLKNVKTNHQWNLEPANGEFPVLIFSPGFYTPASGYLSIIEEIVSHGYVVFNIRHPYETMAVEYPDGRKAFFDQAFNNNNSWNWNDEVAANMDILANSDDDEEKRIAVKNTVMVYGAPVVKRWAEDIQHVIDAITSLNEDASFPLNGQLKLDRLGVYGHSLGGAAALEAAIFDDRIKAAVNLDGAQWGNLMDNPLQKPNAIMSSSSIIDQADPNKYIFEKSVGQDFYYLVLSNTGHSNFSDIPFMINIPQLNESGNLAPDIASKTTNEFLLKFFNKYVRNDSVNLNTLIDENDLLNRRE